MYRVPLSAVNGSSRLTKLTLSKGAGMADSIRKFSNWPFPFESNRTTFDSRINQLIPPEYIDTRADCYITVVILL